MLDEIERSAEPLTLIALGPLTNIAAAITRDPATMRRVSSLVVMGGSLYAGGNVTPYAEFNFYVDPESADAVLAAGLPLTLVPLDVTHQLVVRDETIEGRLLSLKDRRSVFLGELISRNAPRRVRQWSVDPARSRSGGRCAVARALHPPAVRPLG